MWEIKLVDGQLMRKELKEMEKMNVEYDTLQEKLESIYDIICVQNNKTQEERRALISETNEIEQVLDELSEKLNLLQLYLEVEDGEPEEDEDIEIEKNDHFTTLNLVVTYKKFLRGRYERLEVLEKFVIETKKLPENFEAMKQDEQRNFLIENGIFQQ